MAGSNISFASREPSFAASRLSAINLPYHYTLIDWYFFDFMIKILYYAKEMCKRGDTPTILSHVPFHVVICFPIAIVYGDIKQNMQQNPSIEVEM